MNFSQDHHLLFFGKLLFPDFFSLHSYLASQAVSLILLLTVHVHLQVTLSTAPPSSSLFLDTETHAGHPLRHPLCDQTCASDIRTTDSCPSKRCGAKIVMRCSTEQDMTAHRFIMTLEERRLTLVYRRSASAAAAAERLPMCCRDADSHWSILSRLFCAFTL